MGRAASGDSQQRLGFLAHIKARIMDGDTGELSVFFFC
jgi:hypothetical protein